MAVRIIAGSTADMPKADKEKIKIVPLTLHFGEEEYLDGVDIDNEEFYRKLEEGKISPTTSQPSPNAFKKVYDQVIEDGDQAVVITVSSKISGTYQSAILAAQGLEDKIFVVDSQSASVGEGALVQMALGLVEKGLSAIEIVKIIEEEKKKLEVVALLDTLEYLVRGGRLSKTSGLVGKLLSIKVVLTIGPEGIYPLGKARGLKNANNLLNTEIDKAGGIDFTKPLLIGYTGNDSTQVDKYIDDAAYIWQDHIDRPSYVSIGSVIGTHGGPGAVVVAFFRKK